MADYERLIAGPDYDPTLDDLADLGAVERFDVRPATVRRRVVLFAPMDRPGVRTRLAIVAAGDAVYGMARMYEILRSAAPEEICVFRDTGEARAWLAAPT